MHLNMKQHFLKLGAGPSWCELGLLTITTSLFQFGTWGGLGVGLHMPASQQEGTHIYTNTHTHECNKPAVLAMLAEERTSWG